MNEIANLCELVGADVDKVREGIGSDERIGHRFLHAGIGYGGSCFPKDVMALRKSAAGYGCELTILRAVSEVNDRQQHRILEKLAERIGEDLTNKTIAVWGLSFKPDTDDVRESPALEIIRELKRRGAAVQAYDPEAMDNTKRFFPEGEVRYATNATAALKNADVLLLLTEWKEFAGIDPRVLAQKLKHKLILDGRNVFTLEAMEGADLTYVSIGRRLVEGGDC